MTVQEFYNYCKKQGLLDCEMKICSGPYLHDIRISGESKEDNIVLLG